MMGDRIVHLDLKGAPLKISYLEKMLLAAKSWGATGILLEWEDTFPYANDLSDIGSLGAGKGEGMYSIGEVKYILSFIQGNGLKAIQLVQTIGHMEFALKHPHLKHLREDPRSPTSLCPSKPLSQQLVRAMLDQVLAVQPDAEYFHIGADEVWHTGVCEDCQRLIQESRHGTHSLILKHIRDLALFLKQKRPNLNILIWDDMLRKMNLEELRDYHLGELVQPVVWDYSTLECFSVDPRMWSMYLQVFSRIWGGSAYKGANGSCKIVSPVQRYVSNHIAWLKVFQKLSPEVSFCGIVLTGWSRYDHYATLCELMPVSLPSLASCLKTMQKHAAEGSSYDGGVIIKCLPSHEWPGEQLARAIFAFAQKRDEWHAFARGDAVATWLNPWQIEKGFTNPLQIQGIASTAQNFLNQFQSLQTELEAYLHTITGERSTEEWMNTLVKPILCEVSTLYQNAETRLRVDASVSPS